MKIIVSIKDLKFGIANGGLVIWYQCLNPEIDNSTGKPYTYHILATFRSSLNNGLNTVKGHVDINLEELFTPFEFGHTVDYADFCYLLRAGYEYLDGNKEF